MGWTLDSSRAGCSPRLLQSYLGFHWDLSSPLSLCHIFQMIPCPGLRVPLPLTMAGPRATLLVLNSVDNIKVGLPRGNRGNLYQALSLKDIGVSQQLFQTWPGFHLDGSSVSVIHSLIMSNSHFSPKCVLVRCIVRYWCIVRYSQLRGLRFMKFLVYQI